MHGPGHAACPKHHAEAPCVVQQWQPPVRLKCLHSGSPPRSRAPVILVRPHLAEQVLQVPGAGGVGGPVEAGAEAVEALEQSAVAAQVAAAEVGVAAAEGEAPRRPERRLEVQALRVRSRRPRGQRRRQQQRQCRPRPAQPPHGRPAGAEGGGTAQRCSPGRAGGGAGGLRPGPAARRLGRPRRLAPPRGRKDAESGGPVPSRPDAPAPRSPRRRGRAAPGSGLCLGSAGLLGTRLLHNALTFR